MKKNNRRKLLEFYAKASTPEELFVDVIEKTDTIKEKVDSISERFDNVLSYIDANKPISDKDLLVKIKSLIPKQIVPKNGSNPTAKELMALIRPLIPKPIPGKDGSIITPAEVRDKLKSLKGKERLSVFDLKDVEWIKTDKGYKMQWAPANGAGFADISKLIVAGANVTITGSGTKDDPLVINSTGGGSGGNDYIVNWFPTEAKNNSNTIYSITPGDTFVTGTTQVYYQGQRQMLGTEYTEISDTQIQLLTQVPAPGDTLVIDYQKDSTPIGAPSLLLETGGHILLENGGRLLLE